MPASATTATDPRRASTWILSVGDELLAGEVVDTNRAHLAQRCRILGLPVDRALTVGDDPAAIVEALGQARQRARICLVTGGLGPTSDDRTAGAIARAAGVELHRNRAVEQRLRERFAGRDAALVELNLSQADFPEGAQVLANPIGTAPGFLLELSDGPCLVASLPGVPREMERMMHEELEPILRDRFPLRPVARRVHLVVGLGESLVQQRITPAIEDARRRSAGLAALFVHYRARYPEVWVGLEARAPVGSGAAAAAASDAELESLDESIAAALAPGWVGSGEMELAERLVRELTARGRTLATAESCTGGLVGEWLTAIPGASACYLGGVVGYADAAKRELLGISREDLEAHGAVSEAVARAMAEGIRRRLGSDLAVAVTGIAGPSGGSPAKPVGTVDFAVSDARGTVHHARRLHGDRGTVRRAAAVWALKFLWDRVQTWSR